MTLEIFDYLLIRHNCFVNNPEALDFNQSNDVKKQFANYTKCISKIIQHEDITLLCKDIQDEILSIVQKYRFDYLKDKEITESVNYIIDKFNEYTLMSDTRKNNLINEWYKNEYKDRLLPRKYCRFSYINLLTVYDLYNLEIMSGLIEATTDSFNGNYATQSCEISAVSSYASTFNLLINRFPNRFDKQSLEVVIKNLTRLINNTELSKTDLMYIKKTINNIKKILNPQKQKILKF